MSDIQNYILTAIDSFLDNEPDTPFQRGYLAALIELADNAGLSDHETVKAGRDL